mmetsp:Transcript_7689/g.15064  ORF Transcript_7689/g.15064 Transcript_7689/m.15064 type:complete len:155 (+) Transcript_7689:334-798(+)
MLTDLFRKFRLRLGISRNTLIPILILTLSSSNSNRMDGRSWEESKAESKNNTNRKKEEAIETLVYQEAFMPSPINPAMFILLIHMITPTVKATSLICVRSTTSPYLRNRKVQHLFSITPLTATRFLAIFVLLTILTIFTTHRNGPRSRNRNRDP